MEALKLQELGRNEAKVELYSLERYKQITGIDVNFSENEYFAALVRAGDHKPCVFEQDASTQQTPNTYIHTVLLIGSYEAIIAGEYYVKDQGNNVIEVLPSNFANHPSVEITYKSGSIDRKSTVGYKPERTRPISIKFSPKDLA